MKLNIDRLLLFVDLAGTFIFALEGALTAIDGKLDLLGVMVLAFSTALGGGIVRDLLIGAAPPNSIRDWRYGAVAFLGAGITFFWYGLVRQIPPSLIMVLDAAGLSLFAVSGAGKAMEFGIHPFIAALMGTITGVGGGTIRDMMLARIPNVLQSEIYAVAALAGSTVMIVGLRLRQSPSWMAFLGGVTCFLLRVVSVWEHWNLPKIAGP
jgi:uncharacterized membrane protein YeiH